MIITECTNCHEQFFYPYEAGDEPCGKGIFGRWKCEKCKANNYTERTSMNGITYSEEEFFKLNFDRIEVHYDKEIS